MYICVSFGFQKETADKTNYCKLFAIVVLRNFKTSIDFKKLNNSNNNYANKNNSTKVSLNNNCVVKINLKNRTLKLQ